jgi:hypothetical protein
MNAKTLSGTGLLPVIACAGLVAILGGCGEQRSAGTYGASATGAPAKGASRTAVNNLAAQAKPASPIILEFVAESPPAAGAATRIVLTVASSADLPDCEVTVRLPEGVALAGGSLSWRGAVAREGRQALPFTVQVPAGRRCEIAASARCAFPDGTVAARSSTLVLNPEAGHAKPDVPPGTLKINDRGERILELPGGDLEKK